MPNQSTDRKRRISSQREYGPLLEAVMVGIWHACHASELFRKMARAHEASDTSDNNLSRSDSAERAVPTTRLMRPSAICDRLLQLLFLPHRAGAPSFFPSFFRSLRLFFFIASVLPARDTVRFLPFNFIQDPKVAT